jgi:hypothetical protein
MEKIRMYKEMDIKFIEFDAAMLRLGYAKTSDDKFIIYTHEESGSIVHLSQYHKSLDFINKGWFIAKAYNMEGFGVINHRDDLAKMIEQMRLEPLSSVA